MTSDWAYEGQGRGFAQILQTFDTLTQNLADITQRLVQGRLQETDHLVLATGNLALLLLAALAISLLGAFAVCDDGCGCSACSLACASCSCCQSTLTASLGSCPSPGGDAGPLFASGEGVRPFAAALSVFHVPKSA